MLLLDDSKKLEQAFEKALGEEAAVILTRTIEVAHAKWKYDFDTKADLMTTQVELRSENAKVKSDIIRWMVGGLFAQSALLVAVIAFLK